MLNSNFGWIEVSTRSTPPTCAQTVHPSVSLVHSSRRFVSFSFPFPCRHWQSNRDFQYSIPRNNIIIATKVNSLINSEDVAQGSHPANYMHRDYINNYGLSRAAIFNATEGCLERLGVEYIDLLQIHGFDRSVPVEETMKALHDPVQSGKVRYIGAGSMRCWQFG